MKLIEETKLEQDILYHCVQSWGVGGEMEREFKFLALQQHSWITAEMLQNACSLPKP